MIKYILTSLGTSNLGLSGLDNRLEIKELSQGILDIGPRSFPPVPLYPIGLSDVCGATSFCPGSRRLWGAGGGGSGHGGRFIWMIGLIFV